MASPPAEKAADDGAWTVGKIIDWTTGHLKKHGSDTPRLEAEILLAHARNTATRIQLYVHYNEVLSDAERATMRDARQTTGPQAEPVAYLVGHREFFGLDFSRRTPDVPGTAAGNGNAGAGTDRRRQGVGAPAAFLDLFCTGSGCNGRRGQW